MSVPLPTSVFGKSVTVTPTSTSTSTSKKANRKQVAAWSVATVVTGVAIALIIYFLVKMSNNTSNMDGEGRHRGHHRHHRHHRKIKPTPIIPIPIHVNPSPPNPEPKPGPGPEPKPGPGPEPNPIPVKPHHHHPHSHPTHLVTPVPPRTFSGTLAPQVLNRYEIFSRPCVYSERNLMGAEDSRYEYDNVEPRVGFDSRPDNQVTAAYPYMEGVRAGASQGLDGDAILVFYMDGCGHCEAAKKHKIHELLNKITGKKVKLANMEDAKKHGVSGFPTFKLKDKVVPGYDQRGGPEEAAKRIANKLGLNGIVSGAAASSPGALAQVAGGSGYKGMVFLVMDGCGYCDKLKQEVIPNLSANDVTVVNVKDAPKELTDGVQGFPHTHLFDKNGQKVGEISGYAPLEKFIEKLKKIYG